jgi:hypothetical protein
MSHEALDNARLAFEADAETGTYLASAAVAAD